MSTYSDMAKTQTFITGSSLWILDRIKGVMSKLLSKLSKKKKEQKKINPNITLY